MTGPKNIKDILERIKEYKGGTELGSPPITKLIGSTPYGGSASIIAKLRMATELLSKKHAFKVGDIVRGKPGVAENYRGWDQPHIIQEVFEKPIRPTFVLRDAGINNAGHIYDGVMGKIDNDGEYNSFLCDFRYWEPWPEKE